MRALPRLRLIWGLLGPERPLYLLGAAAAVASSLLAYGVPLGVQALLDGVLSEHPERASAPARAVVALLGGREALAASPARVGFFIAAAAALAGVGLWVKGVATALASQRSVRRLRERVYRHLQHLPVAFFRRHESGDLLQRCTSDVDTILSFLSSQTVEIVRCSSLLLAALPLMLLTDVPMTLASLAAVPLILWFSLFFFARVRHRFLAKDEAEGRLTARAQENLHGIRVVRAFHRGEFERSRFRAANDEHRRLDARLFATFALFWSTSDVICILQLGGAFGYGLWRLSQETLSVGDVAFFLVAVNLWLWPFRMMGRILADLGKATVAMDRLQAILDEPEEADPASPAAPPAVRPGERGHLRVVDLSFRHEPAAPPALERVSFEARPGETVAIMGPSGAGKSTLVDLLLRFHDPQEGRIELDGADIATLPRAWSRQMVATVLQQPFLFSRSIRDNLALAAPEADDHAVVAAARDAALHASIERFEQGYQTIVGERGITLSGGQRQRLAIARAILRDAPILVLDDALSAVDNETEREIVAAIRARHGRRTTLVIAHRLSTLAAADRVVVLERGRVVDQGTPEQLRRRDGLFRRLWEIQAEVEREGVAPLEGGGP
ncbi:MAG: ABC transporter ATP-binding protein [Phycisphaerales bacterium]